MKIYKIFFIACVIILQSCKNTTAKKEEVADKNITIFCIGDSTMADKKNPETNPEHGWAQVLEQYFNDKITVSNHAVNGRSSRSFIGEHRWEKVLEQLQKEDYVLIQFGHNDQKFKSPDRYTNPYTGYRNHLIKFVEEARAKGAHPILLTSIVRRNFNEYGTLIDTHGNYPLVVRMVAQEYHVPLVDMQYLTEVLEMSYGVEESKKLHLHYLPNEVDYYPKGKADDTHLSLLGANEVSKLFINDLKSKKHPLVQYLK
ncbi:rhamnogalacturonan acetylesterase [Wenyingzhuangia sp. IMCC45467]